MPGEVLDGTPWLERVPAEDRERLVGEFRRARALGERASLDVRVVAGIDRWARIHMAPVYEGRGPADGPRRDDRGRHRRGDRAHGARRARGRVPDAGRALHRLPVAPHARRHLPLRVAGVAGRCWAGTPTRCSGRTPSELGLDHPEDMEIIERNWVEALREERPRTAAYRARRRDGSIVWLETTFRAVRGPGGEALEMVCVSRDISERKSAELELAHRALHDGLTGLPNRTLFLDRLGQALRRSRRRDRGVAVVFLDLDRFKVVNDSLGHKAGDRLLVDVAMRLSSALRPSDTLARFGGDELTLLCEDIGDAERRPRRSPSACSTPSPSPSSSRTARRSCRRASASRSRATASRRPRTSSATPTPRCTAPRTAARASSSSTRPCARTSATASRWRPRCAAASGAASCACTASRWSRWPTRASRASRRSCAGSIPSAASCRPGRSSRWPRRPGSSSPSAPGS